MSMICHKITMQTFFGTYKKEERLIMNNTNIKETMERIFQQPNINKTLQMLTDYDKNENPNNTTETMKNTQDSNE